MSAPQLSCSTRAHHPGRRAYERPRKAGCQRMPPNRHTVQQCCSSLALSCITQPDVTAADKCRYSSRKGACWPHAIPKQWPSACGASIAHCCYRWNMCVYIIVPSCCMCHTACWASGASAGAVSTRGRQGQSIRCHEKALTRAIHSNVDGEVDLLMHTPMCGKLNCPMWQSELAQRHVSTICPKGAQAPAGDQAVQAGGKTAHIHM